MYLRAKNLFNSRLMIDRVVVIIRIIVMKFEVCILIILCC